MIVGAMKSHGRIVFARLMLREAFGPFAGNSTLSRKAFDAMK
jgi:hypothetical protein